MKFMLKAFRFGVETVLTRVQRWEDRRPDDYRLSDLRTGLWQASGALRELIEGRVSPGRKYAFVVKRSQPLAMTASLTERYTEELLPDVSNPVHSVKS